MRDKLEFFGTLHHIESLSQKALQEIKNLWESGNIRLLPDDLVLMNSLISNVKKNLAKTAKYNHTRFGRITNENIEGVDSFSKKQMK